MSDSSKHLDASVSEIAAKATEIAALAERISAAGEGLVAYERREQLRALRDALIDAERIVKAAAQEAESAHAVLMAAPEQPVDNAWVARYVPSSEDIRWAKAVLQQQADPVLFAELVRQDEERRRLAPERVRKLLAEQPHLHELAARGEPVRHSLELLAQSLSDPNTMLAWLNTAHPDLGRRTPLQVMQEGHADAVETLLANAAEGIPT